MEDDWQEVSVKTSGAVGKFDVKPNEDWEDVGGKPNENWQDSVPRGANPLASDYSKLDNAVTSIKEGVLHPLDTASDLVNSVSYGNVFRKPVAKAVSGIEAGVQEVGDLFRPEGERRDFKERLMENFKERMSMDEARQKERESRSPYAAPTGSGIGMVGSAGTIPMKMTGLGKGAGALDRILTTAGSSAALEGSQSEDKIFDPNVAADAANISGGIQAGFEAIPYVGKAGKFIGKKVGALASGLPEENLSRYYKNPEAVKSSPDLEQLSYDVTEGIQTLKKKVNAGSKAATEKIPEDLKIERSVLLDPLDKIRDSLAENATTKSTKAAVKELGEINRELRGGTKLDLVENKPMFTREEYRAAADKTMSLQGENMEKARKMLDPKSFPVGPDGKKLYGPRSPFSDGYKPKPEFAAEYKELKAHNDFLEKNAIKMQNKYFEALPSSQELSNTSKVAAVPSEGPIDTTISGRNVKGVIKQLDRDIRKADKQKLYDDPVIIAKKEYRKTLDTILKDMVPDYRSSMEAVAKDTGALSNVGGFFKKQDAIAKRLPSLANQPQKNPKAVSALKGLEESLGTPGKYTEANLNRKVREGFDQDRSGGRGDRNTAILSALGGLVDFATGGSGLVGGTSGYGVGKIIDSYAPKITQKVIGAASFMSRLPESKLGKFAKPLADVVNQGPTALGITHMLLMDKSPEYNQLVDNELNREALKKLSTP